MVVVARKSDDERRERGVRRGREARKVAEKEDKKGGEWQ